MRSKKIDNLSETILLKLLLRFLDAKVPYNVFEELEKARPEMFYESDITDEKYMKQIRVLLLEFNVFTTEIDEWKPSIYFLLNADRTNTLNMVTAGA